MGSTICVPALMVGGMIGVGLPFISAVLAMILGFALVVVYMILIGSQGADLGVPTTVAFSRAFADRGSGVASGLVIAICGSSFCQILSTYAGVDFPLWLSTLIWGAAMLLTAVYGIKIIDVLNKISVPALLIMLVYGLIYALTRLNAESVVSSYVPDAPITFVAGLTFAVSGFAVGAVLSSDYTRYCKNRKGALLSSIFGVLPSSVLALVIGGVLAVSTGNYDLTVMFSSMGLPVIGLLCLILATWTTNCGNAYSGGIINLFTAFLGFISLLVPPMAGVVIADYWIIGRGDPAKWRPWKGVNWLGVIYWAARTGFGIAFNFFTPTINAIIVCMIVYLILDNVVKSHKINPFRAPKYLGQE